MIPLGLLTKLIPTGSPNSQILDCSNIFSVFREKMLHISTKCLAIGRWGCSNATVIERVENLAEDIHLCRIPRPGNLGAAPDPVYDH